MSRYVNTKRKFKDKKQSYQTTIYSENVKKNDDLKKSNNSEKATSSRSSVILTIKFSRANLSISNLLTKLF